MASVAKKPTVLEEPEVDLENDEEEDDEDDGDEDEDEDDEDDEEESDELTPADVATDVASALRDAHEACASAIAEKGKVLLDLDDDSKWVLIVKRRE